jgi:hypothetical protein
MTPSYPVVRSSLPLTRRSALLAAGGLLAVPLGGAASNRQRHRVHGGVHGQATQPFAYQRTIGVTGVPGADNDHFNVPYDVTVVDNRLYVADRDNHRVQVFGITRNGTATYQRTIGVTGGGDADNDHFYFPHGLTVALNRLYVADQINQRVE